LLVKKFVAVTVALVLVVVVVESLTLTLFWLPSALISTLVPAFAVAAVRRAQCRRRVHGRTRYGVVGQHVGQRLAARCARSQCLERVANTFGFGTIELPAQLDNPFTLFGFESRMRGQT